MPSNAAFGHFPQVHHRRARNDREAAREMPLTVAKALMPQDAVDAGLMMFGGPLGKAGRKLGAALIAGGAATDAEAGNIIPAVLTGMRKHLPQLMEDLRNGASRIELFQKYGLFPVTRSVTDVVEHLPTPANAQNIDQALNAWKLRGESAQGRARVTALDDLLEHEELYSKVPDLRSMTVAQLAGMPKDTAGAYLRATRGNVLPRSGRAGPAEGLEMVLTGPDPFRTTNLDTFFQYQDDFKPLFTGQYNTLDHEVNHALQARAKGSADLDDVDWSQQIHEIAASLGAQDVPTKRIIEQLDTLEPLADMRRQYPRFEAPRTGTTPEVVRAQSYLHSQPDVRKLIRDAQGFSRGGLAQLKECTCGR